MSEKCWKHKLHKAFGYWNISMYFCILLARTSCIFCLYIYSLRYPLVKTNSSNHFTLPLKILTVFLSHINFIDEYSSIYNISNSWQITTTTTVIYNQTIGTITKILVLYILLTLIEVVNIIAFSTEVSGFKPGRCRRIFRTKKASARLPSEGK